ncbi:hypothetical protein SAMN04488522_101921 [Pedobacter caeni]|uniref:SecDF P1 head subdomain domain-containing protein n=2 Tax=Pedobacter caeni TaxID=288992 RepID=A0A1M4VIY8_9SPHI|nr:hypothetical protein SAMN04488522_101921 [Pedobacter caeni]
MIKRKQTFVVALKLSLILLIVCAVNKSIGRETMQGESKILKTGWYYVVDGPKGFKRQLDKSEEHCFIDKTAIVTASNFNSFLIDGSTLNAPKYKYRLVMELDLAGAKLMGIATKKSIGKKLAFILDNKLLYVVSVRDQVDNGITVMDRGIYSKEELEKFKAMIKAEH